MKSLRSNRVDIKQAFLIGELGNCCKFTIAIMRMHLDFFRRRNCFAPFTIDDFGTANNLLTLEGDIRRTRMAVNESVISLSGVDYLRDGVVWKEDFSIARNIVSLC